MKGNNHAFIRHELKANSNFPYQSLTHKQCMMGSQFLVNSQQHIQSAHHFKSKDFKLNELEMNKTYIFNIKLTIKDP